MPAGSSINMINGHIEFTRSLRCVVSSLLLHDVFFSAAEKHDMKTTEQELITAARDGDIDKISCLVSTVPCSVKL